MLRLEDSAAPPARDRQRPAARGNRRARCRLRPDKHCCISIDYPEKRRFGSLAMWPTRNPFACCRLIVQAGLSCARRGVYKPRPFAAQRPTCEKTTPPWHKQSPAQHTRPTTSKPTGDFWALALGSIGVVYGDIGTSPLYAIREAVTAANEQGSAGAEAVLGMLSLVCGR